MDGVIIYEPPKLPDPAFFRPDTIFKANDGSYWELSGWLGEPERVGVWYRMHNARVRMLKRKGRIVE